MSKQTRQAYANIATVLAAVGGTLADIVSVTTYYVDQDHSPAIQSVRSEVLGYGHPPASTSIMVAGLGHADFLVELTPVAVVPMDRYRDPA